MSPGSHMNMILLVLWAQKETTKYMVQVHTDGTDCLCTLANTGLYGAVSYT